MVTHIKSNERNTVHHTLKKRGWVFEELKQVNEEDIEDKMTLIDSGRTYNYLWWSVLIPIGLEPHKFYRLVKIQSYSRYDYFMMSDGCTIEKFQNPYVIIENEEVS